MSQPTVKALAACILFTLAGVLGWLRSPESLEAFALLGYYAVLLTNTFFSIRTFATLTPRNGVQLMFDGLLAGLYIALAFSFGSVLTFSALSAVLFLIAVGKYAQLDRLIATQPRLLRRKIRLNALACLLSVAAFIIALASPSFSAWTLFALFALGNVYVLFVKPMYRLDQVESPR